MEPMRSSVTGHFSGPFDERRFTEWVVGLRNQLAGPADLGLLFAAAPFFESLDEVLEIIRIDGRVACVAGCSANGLVSGGREIEEEAGLSLTLFAIPGAIFHGFHLPETELHDRPTPADLRAHLPSSIRDTVNGFFAFADPFELRGEQWLQAWNQAFPGKPLIGGLAMGRPQEPASLVFLDGKVFGSGMVAVAVAGSVGLIPVVAQGCDPVGETWTITRVDRNAILQIANQPAVKVLHQTFEGLNDSLKRRARGNLFAGLVVDEYHDEFHRGDFLVRNLLGADAKTGSVLVAAIPRAGQTLQFQLRDAAAADADLHAVLQRARREIGTRTVHGGLLCSCVGRGKAFFGSPHHDAGLLQSFFPDAAFGGFFGNGEFGPIGDPNYIHGYTATAGILVGPAP